MNAEELCLRPLPDEAKVLLSHLKIPARLSAHLALVCDAARRLLGGLSSAFPALRVDENLVLFGAATHDIGKCIRTEELARDGSRHEAEGNALLLRLGVGREKARFALTHSTWTEKNSLEELLVSLADKAWKGSRVTELEDLLTAKIALATGGEPWEVYGRLDAVIHSVAESADRRLEWQGRFAV